MSETDVVNAVRLRCRCGQIKNCSNPTYCRSCYNAYKRQWYQKNREKEIARCAAYNKANPHVPREAMRRVRLKDPALTLQKFKEWRAMNVDKVAQYDVNKRCKRKGAFGSHSLREWRVLVAAWGGRCAYCGVKPKRLTRDHMIPLSRGGANLIDNILPACFTCNTSKNALTAEEFIQRGVLCR